MSRLRGCAAPKRWSLGAGTIAAAFTAPAKRAAAQDVPSYVRGPHHLAVRCRNLGCRLRGVQLRALACRPRRYKTAS